MEIAIPSTVVFIMGNRTRTDVFNIDLLYAWRGTTVEPTRPLAAIDAYHPLKLLVVQSGKARLQQATQALNSGAPVTE